MSKNAVLSFVSILLVLLGIVMIVIGFINKPIILAPPITGVGFILISLVFLKLRD